MSLSSLLHKGGRAQNLMLLLTHIPHFRLVVHKTQEEQDRNPEKHGTLGWERSGDTLATGECSQPGATPILNFKKIKN